MGKFSFIIIFISFTCLISCDDFNKPDIGHNYFIYWGYIENEISIINNVIKSKEIHSDGAPVPSIVEDKIDRDTMTFYVQKWVETDTIKNVKDTLIITKHAYEYVKKRKTKIYNKIKKQYYPEYPYDGKKRYLND